MAWTLKATWPIASGDKVTAAHFNDLHKMMWALEYGLPIHQDSVPDYVADAYSSSATYVHPSGSIVGPSDCLFEGYHYKFCPTEKTDTITGKSPAEDNRWKRSVRQNIYTDFLPSHACHFCIWRDYTPTEGVWRIIPAYMFLPPLLNKYHQFQTPYASLHPGYAMPRPMEESQGYDAPWPVRFRKYYNDARYGQGAAGYLQQIISGPIGARHAYSLPDQTCYRIINGTPAETDAGQGLFDEKLNGYQSCAERICETDVYAWPTSDELYFWEPDAVHFRAPNAAVMTDEFWRCNISPFELALKILGHYDWYLDITTPPQPTPFAGQNPDPEDLRLGTWRRMWRFSHEYPGNAAMVWPGELGTPPYADDEMVSGTPRFASAQAAHIWWRSEANVNTAAAAAQAILNANPEAVAAMDKRHLPVQTTWYKSDDVPCPEGYPEYLIGEEGLEEAWWAERPFVLRAELVQDIFDVLNLLKFVYIPDCAAVTFAALDNMESSDAAQQRFDTFEECRDYGGYLGYQITGTGGSSGRLGYRSWAINYAKLQDWYTRGTPIELYGFVLQATSISAKLQWYIDTYGTDVPIYFALTVQGDAAGGTPPADTDTVVYDIPEVTSDSDVAGLSIAADHYDGAQVQYTQVTYDALLNGWKCLPAKSLAEAWTKPPPMPPSGEYFSYSYLRALLRVETSQDCLVQVDLLALDLQTAAALRDTPPT